MQGKEVKCREKQETGVKGREMRGNEENFRKGMQMKGKSRERNAHKITGDKKNIKGQATGRKPKRRAGRPVAGCVASACKYWSRLHAYP